MVEGNDNKKERMMAKGNAQWQKGKSDGTWGEKERAP
jgi:hypothetical protein